MRTSAGAVPSAPGVAVDDRMAFAGRAPWRALAPALVALVLGAALYQGLSGGHSSVASAVRARAFAQKGLLSLPRAAQGPVSAALGADRAAYRARADRGGFRATSPRQHLRSSFTSSGVSVSAGAAHIGLGLRAVGYGSALAAVGAVPPSARANRVLYAHAGVSEWYANGPLGLEQGFTLAHAPAGTAPGPLTLSIALSGNARASLAKDGQSLTLTQAGRAALRYTGLSATDARGRRLHSWLQLQGARILLHVDSSGARYPLRIDPFIQTAELSASQGGEGDALGWAVAVSGDTVVAGPQQHTVGENEGQGAVYVFEEPASGWANATQTAELTASDPGEGEADSLGVSVAISGNTIVAGAPFHKVGSNAEQGAVYVFEKPGSGWVDGVQTAELTASDGALDDRLGESVGVSGQTIVAGAGNHKVGSNAEQGAVYVFEKHGSAWANGTQGAELTASDGASNDRLGEFVAVSGETIAAGARFHKVGSNADQGAAYVYEKHGSTWANATQAAELTASDGGANDELGPVAVAGQTIVAGAPRHKVGANAAQGEAYVFERTGSAWANATQTAELTASDGAFEDRLGESVAVSGETIVIGAPDGGVREGGFKSDQGVADVFERPASGWANATQTAELIGSNTDEADGFGFSVAVSGGTIVAGGPDHEIGPHELQGMVYVFEKPSQCATARGALGVADWGVNGVGQLASGFRSFSSGSGTGYENAPQPVPGLGGVGVTQVKAGFKFGLGLVGTTCTVEAWGSGNRAQLGDGSLADQSHPVTVSGLAHEVKEIAAAGAHAMALLYDGTVWTWGASEYGERGNGESDWEREALPHGFPARQVPAKVEHLPLKVKQIVAGGRRDYALLENGEVMAWGEDNGGKLGVEETVSANDVEQCIGENHATRPGLQCSTIPRKVMINGQPLTGVEVIGAGEETGYAVKGGGSEVYSWGGNGKGQLGDPAVNHQGTATPVRVSSFSPPSPVVEILGGDAQALARLANGGLYGWGADNAGQLGSGAAANTCGSAACDESPVPVLGLPAGDKTRGIAAGEGASYAVEEEANGNRVLYTFGAEGPHELLGVGNQTYTTTRSIGPQPVAGLAGVASIGASATTAVAAVENNATPPPALGVATPAPPANATAGQLELQLSWDNGEGALQQFADEYIIRDRSASGGSFNNPPGSPKNCTPCAPVSGFGVGGLEAEPYEVVVKAKPEGDNAHRQDRRAIVAPAVPSTWPVNTTPPAISGLPQPGETLTASTGAWTNPPSGGWTAADFTYEWLLCEGYEQEGSSENLGSECNPIGATGDSATYVVQSDEVAQTLRVKVKANNGIGRTAAVSAYEVILAPAQPSVPELPPVLLSPPKISGIAVEGKTLAAVPGSWETGENEPTSTEVKWYECAKHNVVNGVVTGATCSLIASGVPSLVLTSTPVGKWIEIKERAINPAGWELGESSADGIASQAPPATTGPPTISGTVEVNQTLTEHEGTWTNPIAPTIPTWTWKLCEQTGGNCQPIPNAVAQTYIIEAADAEHKLEVVEKDTNGFATSEKESAETVEVPKPASPPVTQTVHAVQPDGSSVPTISGSAVQGATLTSHPASWTEAPTGFEYQWKRCEGDGTQCVPIEGATSTSYVLVAADVGKTIVFKETASNSGGSGNATSSATAVVAGAVPVSTAPPVIVGEAREGAPLVEFRGSWSNEATAYRYQWQRCNGSGEECEAIDGATAATYDVPSGDAGHTIRVQETASNATGAGAPAVSSQTPTVAPHPPVEEAPPTITGSGEVNQTLTAEEGRWSGAVGSPGYQWLRCQLTECKLIHGATASTYVVKGEDFGYAIEVRESVSNAGGWEAGYSAAVPIDTQLEPYVTALSRSSGSTGGGTEVTITGKNFAGATGVSFGVTAATSFELLSAEEIRATAPPGSSGTVDVTVTTSGGTSSAGPASQYTYGPSPSVSAIVPAEGPSVGGTAVKIAGSNLAEVVAVKFGESDAQSLTAVSPSSITAIAPAGTGTVGVTVQTRFGTTTPGQHEQYSYTATGPPPAVSKLSAKRGPAAGGTRLTISGSGFTAVSAVDFGNAPAQSFTVESPELIVVESTPPGAAGTQSVTVTTPFGTSPASKHATFKYENPVITQANPNTGPKQGANRVTVTGNGFIPGETSSIFKFGKTPATEIECFSTTHCTMTAPAAKKAGTVDVTVKAVKAASKKTEADHYTYYG